MSGPSPPEASLGWTPASYLLLGAGTLLLLGGVALRSAVPVFVGLPLIVAPIAAALSGPRGAIRARLDWELRGAGAEVRVIGRWRGDGTADLRQLEQTIERPADLAERRPARLGRERGAFEFALDWWAPYPTISIVRPPHAVWRDPLGLIERPVAAEATPLRVERYPSELFRLGAVPLERVLPFPGETRSRQLGSSGEFFGIRDAAPDDPPRRINWRATARLGRRLVNEHQLDRTGDVLVLIDTRPARLGRGTDEVLLGVARAAAIGLVNAFVHEKARVGYAAFGEFVDPVPLGMGRAHRLRLREAIWATRPPGPIGPSERCAAGLSRFYPPGVTTILISSLTGDAEPELVVHLRRRGYPTLVLSPSPTRVQPRGRPLAAEDERLADRLDRLARRQSLARVFPHATVIDWEDLWSLGSFVRLLERPVRRRYS